MIESPDTARPVPDNRTAVLDADFGKPIRLGLLILLVGFGGFMAWAIFAPLDEGVPMPGVVSVESKRKRVEHLTGGHCRQVAGARWPASAGR